MKEPNDFFDISELIGKFLKSELNVVEKQRLDDWLSESELNERLFNRITTERFIQEELVSFSATDKSHGWEKIKERIQKEEPTKRRSVITLVFKYAAIISLVVLAIVLFKDQKRIDKKANIIAREQDILPGGNKATLTLADGTSIVLDEAKNGELAHQMSTVISKSKDGQLKYQTSNVDSDASTHLMNTIATPRGGQFQLILSDGTKVWLNAISSLKYPAEFKGQKRSVELTGEAYFEVAKNREKPFVVNIGKAKVEVLGTHFNIMAYHDEKNTAITLLEGTVKVSANEIAKGKVLSPGQQASIGKDDFISVDRVNVDQSVAWKNGYFQFNRNNIHDVMKQLSRWYDIDVEFEKDMPRYELVGRIRRSVNLSQVLKILNYSNVKFHLEGKKIIIYNETDKN